MATYRDYRLEYLSKQNRILLDFVSNYACTYVQGKNCEMCDMCGDPYKTMSDPWLYLCVETKQHEVCHLICFKCARTKDDSCVYTLIELYPHIKLSDMLMLCRIGVLRQYVFKFDYDNVKTRRVRAENKYQSINDGMTAILKQKQSHEEIVSITLKTISSVIFCEELDDLYIDRGRNMMNISPSQMLSSYYNFKFENVAYYYIIKYRSYVEMQTFQPNMCLTYKFYLAKPIKSKTKLIHYAERDHTLFMSMPYCKWCTAKKKFGSYPILYCSICKLTDYKIVDEYLRDVAYQEKKVKIKEHPKRKHLFMYYDA